MWLLFVACLAVVCGALLFLVCCCVVRCCALSIVG